MIDGHVDGDIVVERLQIKAKAVVKGSLTYKSIEVAEGAQIDGNFVQITQKPQKTRLPCKKLKNKQDRMSETGSRKSVIGAGVPSPA